MSVEKKKKKNNGTRKPILKNIIPKRILIITNSVIFPSLHSPLKTDNYYTTKIAESGVKNLQ